MNGEGESDWRRGGKTSGGTATRQRVGNRYQRRRNQVGKRHCVIILLRKQAYVPGTAWKPRIFSTVPIWTGLSRLNEVT